MNTQSEKIKISNSLPLVSTILLLMLLYIPNQTIIPQNIRPILALSSSFFWLIEKKEIFGMFSLLIISLISGTISSAPVGSNLLMYFTLYVLTNKFEKFFINKGFLIYWYSFCLFAFFAIFLKWLVLSIYYSALLPIIPVFFTYLTTAFSYPIISIINTIIQSFMGEDDE